MGGGRRGVADVAGGMEAHLAMKGSTNGSGVPYQLALCYRVCVQVGAGGGRQG